MTKHDPLASKRRRTERFRFEVQDPTDAEAQLAHANLAVLRARAGTLEADVAQALLDEAKQALEACYGTVTVRAMSPRLQLQFEQEVAERDSVREAAHLAAVAAAEKAGEDPPAAPPLPPSAWDAESFEVRVIAACDADGRTPERWAEVLDLDGDWNMDDRASLLELCHQVNQRRVFNPVVLGKGWAAKRS